MKLDKLKDPPPPTQNFPTENSQKQVRDMQTWDQYMGNINAGWSTEWAAADADWSTPQPALFWLGKTSEQNGLTMQDWEGIETSILCGKLIFSHFWKRFPHLLLNQARKIKFIIFLKI